MVLRIHDLSKTAVDFVQHHAQGLNVQKYLIRVIASKHQVTAIMEWKKRGVFLDLLPEDLRNVTENEVPDMFLLTDVQYKEVRNALRVAWLSGSFEDMTTHVLSSQDKPDIWTLAFHHLTRVNPCQIKDPATSPKRKLLMASATVLIASLSRAVFQRDLVGKYLDKPLPDVD